MLRGLALAFTIAASENSSTQPTDAILEVGVHPVHVFETARSAATVICNRQWPRRTAGEGAYVRQDTRAPWHSSRVAQCKPLWELSRCLDAARSSLVT